MTDGGLHNSDCLTRADAAGPASDLMIEAMSRATLNAAVGLARAGDCQRARELCAAVIFEGQPLIATRRNLLRLTLHALFVARGFKLLSRLVTAMSGSDVQLSLLPHCPGIGAPPHGREQNGRTIYAVDAGWLARLSPDDAFLRHWSDALAEGRCSLLDETVADLSEWAASASIAIPSSRAAMTGASTSRQSQPSAVSLH